MLAILVCYSVGMLLAAAMQYAVGGRTTKSSTLSMIIVTLSFQGAALVLIGRFLREHQVSWSEAFGLRLRLRRAIVLGLVSALVFLPIGIILNLVCTNVLARLHMNPEVQHAVQALDIAESVADKAYLGALAILLAPIAEELLFRGILYSIVKQSGFPRLALYGTSILFGAVHLNMASFFPLAVMGIFLAILYEETKNLLAPIVAHSFFNLANFLLLLFREDVSNFLEKLTHRFSTGGL